MNNYNEYLFKPYNIYNNEIVYQYLTENYNDYEINELYWDYLIETFGENILNEDYYDFIFNKYGEDIINEGFFNRIKQGFSKVKQGISNFGNGIMQAGNNAIDRADNWLNKNFYSNNQQVPVIKKPQLSWAEQRRIKKAEAAKEEEEYQRRKAERDAIEQKNFFDEVRKDREKRIEEENNRRRAIEGVSQPSSIVRQNTSPRLNTPQSADSNQSFFSTEERLPTSFSLAVSRSPRPQNFNPDLILQQKNAALKRLRAKYGNIKQEGVEYYMGQYDAYLFHSPLLEDTYYDNDNEIVYQYLTENYNDYEINELYWDYLIETFGENILNEDYYDFIFNKYGEDIINEGFFDRIKQGFSTLGSKISSGANKVGNAIYDHLGGKHIENAFFHGNQNSNQQSQLKRSGTVHPVRQTSPSQSQSPQKPNMSSQRQSVTPREKSSLFSSIPLKHQATLAAARRDANSISDPRTRTIFKNNMQDSARTGDRLIQTASRVYGTNNNSQQDQKEPARFSSNNKLDTKARSDLGFRRVLQNEQKNRTMAILRSRFK